MTREPRKIGGHLIDDDTVRAHLFDSGYRTVEEWAADSDYTYDKDAGVWLNDEKQPVDIHAQHEIAVAESLDNYE